jgi:hypothetical protein
MRRVLAHLALAATCIGFLSPLLTAAQLSTVHACCLRKGSHHCHELSGSSGEEKEFRAKHEVCPYSARMTLSSFHGLQATKFKLRSPWISGIVAQAAVESGFRAAARRWSARGPPTVLL